MRVYVVNVEEDTWKMHNLHLEITVIVVTLRIILPNTVWQNYLTSYQPMKNLTNFWLEPYRLKQDIKKRITWLKFWHLMTTMQNSNWTQVPNLTFFDKLELNDQQLIKTKVKLITYRGTESYRKSSRLWSARRKVWLEKHHINQHWRNCYSGHTSIEEGHCRTPWYSENRTSENGTVRGYRKARSTHQLGSQSNYSA